MATIRSLSKALTAAMCSATTGGSAVITWLVIGGGSLGPRTDPRGRFIPSLSPPAMGGSREDPLLSGLLFLRMSANELLASSRRDGTTVQSIQYPLFKNMTIPVPPFDERRLIIEVTNTALAKQASIRPRLEAAHRVIERFRQSVLIAACSGGLTADWREAHTETNASHSEASLLPEGWTAKPVREIFGIQNGRAFPGKEYNQEGILLLRPGNLLASGDVSWADERTVRLPMRWAETNQQFILGRGELLMNLTAQSLKDEFLGRVCLKTDDLATWLNQRIARFINLGEYDYRPFPLIYFKSRPFRRFVDGLDSGTLIRHMHSKQILDHVMPIPPKDEQDEIVRRVNALLRLATSIEHRLPVALAHVEHSSPAILAKAFRGELLPSGPTGSSNDISGIPPKGAPPESRARRSVRAWRAGENSPPSSPSVVGRRTTRASTNLRFVCQGDRSQGRYRCRSLPLAAIRYWRNP